MTRPNIIFIHSHDTGRYISPYGYAAPTPNLLRFAREGVVFRQAFCVAPTCSPSRSGLLTGAWPHANGMWGLAHRGFGLNDPRWHLVSTLKAAGYQTILCGIEHESKNHDTAQLGYDQVLKISSQWQENEEVDTTAAAFLQSAPKQPFFLSVGFYKTHRPFPPPEAADDPRFLRPPSPVPDGPETRLDMAGFHASVRRLDDGIGRVLAALEQTGLAANSLIIITTDHGPAFPAMKCNLTDHGIGVLLMMRGPDGFTGGRVIDAMVSQLDLFPTFCDLLNIARPPWLQGVSLMPLIRKQVATVHEAIYAQVNFHCPYEPQRCIRTERFKYIRRFDALRGPVVANCDPSPSRDVWLRHGWTQQMIPREELFDLLFDPNENNNLADRPAYAAVRDELRQRLVKWQRETRDPLLDGPLPAPPGARINSVDAIDPEDTLILADADAVRNAGPG